MPLWRAPALLRVAAAACVLVVFVLLTACSGRTGYAPRLPAGGAIQSSRALEASATRAIAILRALPLRTDGDGLGFDESAAILEARAIARIGVRSAGSAGELRVARHIAARLRAMGLRPRYERFRLPNGRTSVNVEVTIEGIDDSRALLMGGHIDSKAPSPGANDNASGCGVLLQLASTFAERPPVVTVDMVFFGSEEIVAGNPDWHHLGSRQHARGLTAAERRRYAGVVIVDMVGVGDEFVVRTMGRGPRTLTAMLLADARGEGARLSYLRDPGRSGWSDHEPYELLGMPVAWLEWREDPRYHTARDTADRLQRTPLRTTGNLLTGFVYALDEARVARLDAR